MISNGWIKYFAFTWTCISSIIILFRKVKKIKSNSNYKRSSNPRCRIGSTSLGIVFLLLFETPTSLFWLERWAGLASYLSVRKWIYSKKKKKAIFNTWISVGLVTLELKLAGWLAGSWWERLGWFLPINTFARVPTEWVGWDGVSFWSDCALWIGTSIPLIELLPCWGREDARASPHLTESGVVYINTYLEPVPLILWKRTISMS